MKRSQFVWLVIFAGLSINGACPPPSGLGPGCFFYAEAGDTTRQICLTLPAEQTQGVIVYFHGGGWLVTSAGEDGPPAAPADVESYVQQGWALARVSYSLIPLVPPFENTFPVAVQDAKRAVRWLKAHGLDKGVDPEVIVTWGFSAGGHLAAMVGAPSFEPTDLPPPLAAETSWVHGIISFAGALDLARILEIPDLGPAGDPCGAAWLVRGYLELVNVDLADCRANGSGPYQSAPGSPDWNVAQQASAYAVWHAYINDAGGPLPMLFMVQGDADNVLSTDQTFVLGVLLDVFGSPRVDVFEPVGGIHDVEALYAALETDPPDPHPVDAFLDDAWNTYSTP